MSRHILMRVALTLFVCISLAITIFLVFGILRNRVKVSQTSEIKNYSLQVNQEEINRHMALLFPTQKKFPLSLPDFTTVEIILSNQPQKKSRTAWRYPGEIDTFNALSEDSEIIGNKLLIYLYIVNNEYGLQHKENRDKMLNYLLISSLIRTASMARNEDLNAYQLQTKIQEYYKNNCSDCYLIRVNN